MHTEKISVQTPIQRLGQIENNNLFVKREDFIPFSFGGNKARKAILFFEEIDKGDYDCVVTYGSSSSNHCRVVANMAVARDMQCYIISPEEASEETYNSKMMRLFGAEIETVPVNQVRDTIENKLSALKAQGKKPYFIAGGGHGNPGTQAYVDCYAEITAFEAQSGIQFDYIFHATGTGTTQAGLICGKLMAGDSKKIVGISIARKKPYGRDVVLASVKEYLEANEHSFSEQAIEEATLFEDAYVGDGYGSVNAKETIEKMLLQYGIPFDGTYTGKGFNGMLSYLKAQDIQNKNILFIHTGGTPLFFDFLNENA